MLTKQSLSKTFNLINNFNVTVISDTNNNVSCKLALSLALVYFENVQYCPPETIDEITSTIKDLLAQFELKNHCQIELVILNLLQIESYDYMSFSKTLLELNEIAKNSNIKIITLFQSKDTDKLKQIFTRFTDEQAQQILMLTMNSEQQIKIDIETGEHKGKSIYYKYDDDLVEFLREIN